uniref:Glycosyltransferase n=1 Tax=Crocus sativus TaxID=82528 RepID=A0A0A8KB29_CROSA|nr:glucosyltransferase 2 [Crocus sativus]
MVCPDLHVALVAFPTQGHLNPGLRLGKDLAGLAVDVTFCTFLYGQKRMAQTDSLKTAQCGVSMVGFSDIFDDGYAEDGDPLDIYISHTRAVGDQVLRKMILRGAETGEPVTCLIWDVFIPFAADVAEEFNIPCAVLWQSGTGLDAYYFIQNGRERALVTSQEPEFNLKLPGVPLLRCRDIPSFLFGSCDHCSHFNLVVPLFKNLIEAFSTDSRVLVNCFDDLDVEPVNALSGMDTMLCVGPLLPCGHPGAPIDSNLCGDILQNCTNSMVEWSCRPDSSVVYISFGSLVCVPQDQMEEIAHALVKSRIPFLWVIRSNCDMRVERRHLGDGFRDANSKRGMLVAWCGQADVLNHPSIGCFVTHCGWNSTAESLCGGVPVVNQPHWGEQCTNGRQVEDSFKTGVRMQALSEDGVVSNEELGECVDLNTAGKKGEEMRKMASKWKESASRTISPGGKSLENFEKVVKLLMKEKDG